ncbi:hypothetical protein GCM10027275_31500 [Rhabdobacter roseus]|uniref:Phosphoribosylpyrophosphate synthetase n=1 Tax=Rhabdobacter roseus TaxID=1655419 RepID=A0A840TZP4_9BACT|nr:hypothetical protein [Rhabdobacter roseus]MBB5285109.1 hypothetical protein [Rhabdobacter roseus]
MDNASESKEHRNKLDTIVEVLNDLKERGYKYDFNLTAHALQFYENGQAYSLSPDDFEIVEVRRFEGMSDPSDNAIIYVIESTRGLKGTLVDAYGVYSDELSQEMIKKLDTRYTTLYKDPEGGDQTDLYSNPKEGNQTK